MIKKNHGTAAIKICGLTDPVEAKACQDLGADAIGLVFFKKSPRDVSLDQAAAICSALSKKIMTTAVLVNESYDTIMTKVEACSFKAVQLHGQESPELVGKLIKNGLIVIKAVFAKKEPDLNDAKNFNHASGILVEYGKGILPGGNAESWDWGMAKGLNKGQALVLAGGLDPSNVRQAILSVHPDMVDVSSGVEQSFGKKDLGKVASFITAVQESKINQNSP